MSATTPKNYKAIGNELIELIRELFPSNASIIPTFQENFCCDITWSLDNARTRRIVIKIDNSVLEAYDEANGSARENIQNRFIEFAKQKEKQYYPGPDNPNSQTASHELWRVTNKIFE